MVLCSARMDRADNRLMSQAGWVREVVAVLGERDAEWMFS
jgi:hypothetical protein